MHPATAPPVPPAPCCVAERNGSITMVPPRHRRWPPMAVPRCQKHPKWCVGSIDNQICWVFHFEGGNHIDVCFLSLKRGFTSRYFRMKAVDISIFSNIAETENQWFAANFRGSHSFYCPGRLESGSAEISVEGKTLRNFSCVGLCWQIHANAISLHEIRLNWGDFNRPSGIFGMGSGMEETFVRCWF